MSDGERGKFYGRKRYSGQRAESNGFGSRFFNSKNGFKSDKESSKDGEKSDGKQKNVKQPTILLKAPERPEERSASPKQKESDNASITIVTNTAHEHISPSQTVAKKMSKSIKLLDDGTLYTENVQEYLLENNDFVVVGLIGPPGVGKSTIANLLTQQIITKEFKKVVFDANMDDDDENVEKIKILTDEIFNFNLSQDKKEKIRLKFKQQQPDDIEANINTTYGIDMYITKNRMILLDCQALMSSAFLDELMRNENKRANVISEFLPLENSGEIQSLQLTAFLMSVCHVLVTVTDWFVDSNLIRFLQTAEMLKPTISNAEDEFTDYFPHLIMLQNKSKMQDFTPMQFKKMQTMYKSMFSNTKMHLESGLGLATGRVMNSLNPENTGVPINLFLVPDYSDKTEGIFKGHPPLEQLVSKLRANLMGATKYPLTHVTLSEKNWLVYSAKVWDHVKKSSFFVEYTKLMP